MVCTEGGNVHDIRQLEEEQHERDERNRYKRRARTLAAIMIPTWFPEYDPAIHEVDHKFSVSSGYQYHIPLEVISGRHNLQLLSPAENSRKGGDCSITLEELLNGYHPNAFVTSAAAILRRMPLWKLNAASVHVSRRLRNWRECRRIRSKEGGCIKDVGESKRVGKRVQSKGNQCYRNAFQVVSCVLGYANAEYVEGIVVDESGMALEHGWVEKDGMIVDPTMPKEELTYFPGLRFKGLAGLAEALRIPKLEGTDDLPIFSRYGLGGIESPEFRSAWIAACRFNGCEDLARRYESYTGVLPA
jgi:hypothetical protein